MAFARAALASRAVLAWGQASPVPTPSSSPAELSEDEVVNQFQVALEELFRKFGVDPANLPDFNPPGIDLILAIIALAAAVLLLRAVYRGMQRPRLNLTYHEDRPPTADAKAILRYLVTPLVWLPLWYFVVLLILMLAANRTEGFRPPDQVVIATAAVIGGSRLLAHVNSEAAHELAKSVPLTLLSLILISGQTITLEGFAVLSLLMVYNIDVLSQYVFLLGCMDVVITAFWWLRRRAQWTASRRPPDPRDGGRLTRLWRMAVEGWGARESGPSATHPQPQPPPAAETDESPAHP